MDDEKRATPKAPRKPATKPKAPRKLSARYLENAALHYLKRFAATEAGLRRVLMRKVDRSLRAHEGDRAEAQGWVDELVRKLVRNGLVNDAAFAEQKAQSLRASGRSARVIAMKLKQKGVPEAVAAPKLREVTHEISEEDAARTWARKKRLGPFRRGDAIRSKRGESESDARRAQRQRDLAALARAGFSFDIARRVIDAPATGASGNEADGDGYRDDVEIDPDADVD